MTTAAPTTTTIYRVFWRASPEDRWLEWPGPKAEADARKTLDYMRSEYPHYESEMRKITMVEERVDV